MEIKTSTVLTAASGRETLIVRFDGDIAVLSIDENDNGTVVGVNGSRKLLETLCQALNGATPAPDSRLTTTLAAYQMASAELSADAEGYELRLAAIGERDRTFRCSHDEGATLRKAIRGSFGFWD